MDNDPIATEMKEQLDQRAVAAVFTGVEASSNYSSHVSCEVAGILHRFIFHHFIASMHQCCIASFDTDRPRRSHRAIHLLVHSLRLVEERHMMKMRVLSLTLQPQKRTTFHGFTLDRVPVEDVSLSPWVVLSPCRPEAWAWGRSLRSACALASSSARADRSRPIDAFGETWVLACLRRRGQHWSEVLCNFVIAVSTLVDEEIDSAACKSTHVFPAFQATFFGGCCEN